MFSRRDSSAVNIRQLQAILSSDLHEHLHATRMLVVNGWGWLIQTLHVGQLEILNPLLLLILCLPRILPLCIYHYVVSLRTRYCLSRASTFNMPNIHRVV